MINCNFKGLNLIDVSMSLSGQTPVYPGDPPCERTVLCGRDQGEAFELSALSFGAHAGTHIDAPKHFLENGLSLDQVKPEKFILPAVVVQANGPVVLDTGYSPGYVHLSLEAARRCLNLGAPLVGLDYLSVDRHGDNNYPVHKVLLGAGCFILEGLDLSEAPPGPYFLICLPLKIHGSEASPVRAVLAAPKETSRLSLTLGGSIY